MPSLYYQEIQFSPVEKRKNTTKHQQQKKKTVAEGKMSSHYKDEARADTNKAAKPFKLTRIINGVIYDKEA